MLISSQNKEINLNVKSELSFVTEILFILSDLVIILYVLAFRYVFGAVCFVYLQFLKF